MTLADTVLKHAGERPDHPAIVVRDKTITYRAIADHILATSAWLIEQGVAPGDRVVLSAHTGNAAFASAYLGTHAAGAIAVPIDPFSPEARIEDLCRYAGARITLWHRSLKSDGIRSYALDTAYRTGGSKSGFRVELGPDMAADLLFTSGSTGRPKGVLLTHGAVAAAIDTINSCIVVNREDIELCPLPLNHSFGLGRLRCVLAAGATLVLIGGPAVPAEILHTLSESGATGFATVPAGIDLLFGRTGDRVGDFADQLRYMELGSSPMPTKNKRRLAGLLPNTRLYMHYGLTEATRSTFLNFHATPEKLDSAGYPARGVKIKILGPDDHECAAGETGRLLISNPAAFTRYWDDPDLTSASTREGYVITGDLGYLDEDGFLYLAGRESETFDISGRQVFPAEVELALADCPGVRDCACALMPNKKKPSGYLLVAFVVADESEKQPTEKQLIRQLRVLLEPHKVPAAIRWVSAIPRTETGKVRRATLVEAESKTL